MSLDEHNSHVEDNLRREKLLELERRQQALQQLCEEALKEDEVENDLPPYLSPPSSGGAFGKATEAPFSRLPPPREPATDDLLTGEVQSFRDPNSVGRASSMNSTSWAPSAPQAGFMPPRRSASREFTGASRPFMPRSTLRTELVAPLSPHESNSGGPRAWSAHAGINKTPMRDRFFGTQSTDSVPAHRHPSSHRNRYFGVLDTPIDSTPSPRRQPYISGLTKRTPPPPPPPRAELLPPDRYESGSAAERTRKAHAPPPPPPPADRALYMERESLDPPPPPPRPSFRRPRTRQVIPPPPPTSEEMSRHVDARRARRHKAPTLSSPSAHMPHRAKDAALRASPLKAPLTLSEAYSRYAPPSSYRNGAAKHFFQKDTVSSAASVAESSSFTSYFSSTSRVEQRRSQLHFNDAALSTGQRPATDASRVSKRKIIEAPPPPPPAPPSFASDSESVEECVSIWEIDSASEQSQAVRVVNGVRSIFSEEIHNIPDETYSVKSEPVHVPPPLPPRLELKKTAGVSLHPYAINAPPPVDVHLVKSVLLSAPQVDEQAPHHDVFSVPPDVQVAEQASIPPKTPQDFFDESPAKNALRHLLVNQSHPPPSLQRQQFPEVSISQNRDFESSPARDKESPSGTSSVRAQAAVPDAVTRDIQEKLRDAQTKTEALARHLVKAINEKKMLAENVIQLEELVEESSFEVGRLQRVVAEQQKEHSSSTEVLTMLRAKEREIAIYEEEIQRLNAAVDRHLLRVATKEPLDTGSRITVAEVEAAMTEVGAAYLAQREAEERAMQLSAELEAAVEQIQTLDERLAEMERAQAASRFNVIRDAVRANEDTDATSTSLASRPVVAEDTANWPNEARRMIAQLTSHAEGLLVQNSESARYASAALRHAEHSREELQHKLRGKSEEVEILQKQCSRLQREKSVLADATEKMHHQLNSVKQDAHLVSELVRTSRNDAEHIIESCASPPAKRQFSPTEGSAMSSGGLVVVKDFAQQVMRDFNAVSRFLAALREMDIGHDNGYEILVKLADGVSPAERLYSVEPNVNTSTTPETSGTSARTRLQKRKEFVVQAVQQALMSRCYPSAGEQSTSPTHPRSHVIPGASSDPDETVVEADAFVPETEVDVVSRIRSPSHSAKVESDKSNSIYRDDTGMVLSGARKTTQHRVFNEAPVARVDVHRSPAAPPSPRWHEEKSEIHSEATQPSSPEARDKTSPPTRIPFSVAEETPPSVSRPLRLSSGTPADALSEGIAPSRPKGGSEEEHHSSACGDSARAVRSCESSGILSVSDIPFDNAEAEKTRQQRSHEGPMADAKKLVTTADQANTPSHTVAVGDEDDVSPVIRPRMQYSERTTHSGDQNSITASPTSTVKPVQTRPGESSDQNADVEAVDLLGEDFVLPSEQQTEPIAYHKSGSPVSDTDAANKSPVSAAPPHSLPPLAPSPQVTPSQSPVVAPAEPLVRLPPASTSASSREKKHAPSSLRSRIADDDDEDNEPSLFFYTDSASSSHVPVADVGPPVEAATQPQGKVQAQAEPQQRRPSHVHHESPSHSVAPTDHNSLASSLDRDSGGHLFHHRPTPSASVSIGGAAPLPRLQSSTTTSPQSVSLAPPAPVAEVTHSTSPRTISTGMQHAETTALALQEPHKASPSKPAEPRQTSRPSDVPVITEELSSVEDDMEVASSDKSQPLEVLVNNVTSHALEEDEPMRRSGTARPSSTTRRVAQLSDPDEHIEDEDDVAVETASPSPKAVRAEEDLDDRDHDSGNRQRSTTAPGGTTGPTVDLPSQPATETPAALVDMPLPAAPLAAPSKPTASVAASRPRAATSTPTENPAPPLPLPRVTQDPPDTQLSMTRDKTPTVAHAEVPQDAQSPPVGAAPDNSGSARQKRKEEVARILERIRLKKEEEAARKKSGG